MPNVTISLDEDVLRASREYARKRDLSLNALIRELLEHRVRRSDAAWIDACFERMDRAAVDSGGRNWKREDLYDV
jgi:predicted transcriptional regulator